MTPRITVPITEAMQAKLAEVDPSHPIVLIVDDEKIIADTLSAIFNKSGFVALTAYEAATALELASLIPPHLLITDVMMPGMNGIDLAIEMEASFPDCKILLFSGQASTMDLLAKARTMGHDFTTLSKPIHPTELLKRAADFLRVRPMLQASASAAF